MSIAQAFPLFFAFSLWSLFTAIYFLALVGLHASLAMAVFNDATRLQSSGKDLFLVGPAIWALAVLLGGLPGIAVYWVVHYYPRLQTKTPPVAVSRPLDPMPSAPPVDGGETTIA